MTNPIISLLVPVRITEEKFSNFIRFFETLHECLDDKKSVEVCIKFDDDQDLTKALNVVETFKEKGLIIKYLISPRGKGYSYFSYFMNDLIFISDSNSKSFCHLTIDFFFNRKGFDSLISQNIRKYDDGIFIIHQQYTGSFLSEIKDVNFSFQFVENAPIVSRKWIEIQSTYGYSSSCDGYIGMVEFFLFNDWGIDRRIDLSSNRFTMETDGNDVNSNYWNGPRRAAMESHLTQQSINFARQAAKNLALNIANCWDKDTYVKYITQSCLNNYDLALTLQRKINQLEEILPSTNNIDTSSLQGIQKKIEEISAENKDCKKRIRRLRRIVFPPLFLYDKVITPLKKLF